MIGTLNCLNVGSGDTVFSFDNKDPAETIRACRIVKDMLRRGYALLVEVERDGVKAFERALDFDEKNARYIIADFDPIAASKADEQEGIDEDFRRESASRRQEEKAYGEGEQGETETTSQGSGEDGEKGTSAGVHGRKRRKPIDAKRTRAVAVGRSSGG